MLDNLTINDVTEIELNGNVAVNDMLTLKSVDFNLTKIQDGKCIS